MREKNLLLFTDSYPFGTAETFIAAEVERLCRAFETVTIIPLRYGGRREARPLPENAAVTGPLLAGDGVLRLFVKGIFNRAPLGPMLRDFFGKRVFLVPRHARKWLEATCVARLALSHDGLRRLLNGAGKETVLYFYWAAGTAWALPFLDTRAPVVSRFHGFDIYEERDDFAGYIPFRERFLERLDWAVFVSEHGRRYLADAYPLITYQGKVFRLGVADAGCTRRCGGKVLHVVSCSRMVPLKRLDLIVGALSLVDFPVEWTHFGDGPLMEAIKALAGKLPARVTCSFAGLVENIEVRRWYREHCCDVFINVSTTEGAPVAVMEALSAGIPVVATDVGGTPELVDEGVGVLLSSSPTAEELADALRELRGDENRRRACAAGARKRWEERFDAEKNFTAFSRFLSEQVPDSRLTSTAGDNNLRRGMKGT